MAYEFKWIESVKFSETDAAGLMHFSNFFRYMENAEHAFFRSLGFSVHAPQADPPIGWPRVHAACDYKRPLRFEDRVEVHLLVREKKSKILGYNFIFRKLNAEPVEEVARGTLTVACVARSGARNGLAAVPLPEAIAGKIEAAPRELLTKLFGGTARL